MSEAFFVLDMERAAEIGGCPVCAVVEWACDRYLDSLLYESVNDPPLRQKLAAALGFCNTHAWALVRAAERSGDGLGVAIVYEHLLSVARWRLATATSSLSLGSRFRALAAEALSPSGRCPACQVAEEREERMLQWLLEHLRNHESQTAGRLYRLTDGLCVPHLRVALTMTDDARVKRDLLEQADRHWQILQHDLSEFCRKHDYRFAEERLTDSEAASWRKAIEVLTGKREAKVYVSPGSPPGRWGRWWLKLRL